MKKKYGYSVVVLVFTLVLPLYAQTDSKEQEAFSLIEKVTQKIQVSKDLTYQMTYRLFEDYQSSKVKESYDGLFKKQGSKRYYTKIDQTEFIQDGSGVMVKVFHDEKVIMASDLELQVGVSVALASPQEARNGVVAVGGCLCSGHRLYHKLAQFFYHLASCRYLVPVKHGVVQKTSFYVTF